MFLLFSYSLTLLFFSVRVCLLTPVLDVFKGGNHLPLLAALPEVDFTIITGRMKPEHPDLPGNMCIEALHSRVSSYYYGCADYLFARALLKRHPADDPFWKSFDVIHINQTMGPSLLALRETGVPLLFFVHHPVSVDLAVALEESSFLKGLHWRLQYFLLCRWQKRFCRELPHIATVSRTAADRIATDYGCDGAKIALVPNGVDETRFFPGDPMSTDFNVIAIGAFIHPRKGFRYLLDAYRLLGERGLTIADVGRRSAEQQAVLRSIPNVRTFGTVPQEELVHLMRRSAVLLSTSLYEGFGLSLIEALACGRPAFAFDAGAVREVLSPIDAGLVVPLRDTAELARRVLRFLERTPADRERAGAAYREAVTSQYPLTAAAEALRTLYEWLAPSSSSSHTKLH